MTRPTSTLLLAVFGLLGCNQADSNTDAASTSTSTTSPTETGTGDTSTGDTSTDDNTTTDEELGPQGVDLNAPPPDLLSSMNLLEWDGTHIIYKPNVYPYDMNVALFTDFAFKDRAVFIPPGEAAAYPETAYPDNAAFDYPIGAVIVKSFMYPADMREPEVDVDLIETRVMIRYPDEWLVLPYVWDHELGDAVLTVQGTARAVTFIGEDGVERTSTYLVPQKNQCAECHEIKDANDETIVTALGPNPRNINRIGVNGENQLEHMAAAGALVGLPPIGEVPVAWDDRTFKTTPVEDLDPETLEHAARDYLDVNCSSCHNPRGVHGISSQLFLNWDNTDDFHLGVCKKPGSAGKGGEGRTYDIVPGDADASILVYRVETLEVGSMMPLLGRSLVHEDGVALLRAWVDSMPPNDCSGN